MEPEHSHTFPLYTKEVFDSQKGPTLQSFCIDCGKKVKEVKLGN